MHDIDEARPSRAESENCCTFQQLLFDDVNNYNIEVQSNHY